MNDEPCYIQIVNSVNKNAIIQVLGNDVDSFYFTVDHPSQPESQGGKRLELSKDHDSAFVFIGSKSLTEEVAVVSWKYKPKMSRRQTRR